MNVKVRTFKIFPDNTDWYYKVYIFGQKRTMQAFRMLLQKEDKASKMRSFKFEAICSAFESKIKGNEKQYGVLLFYKGSSAKSGVVSHEITHAAIYWWKYMVKMKWEQIPKAERADEKFAHLIGRMVAQYWSNWYDCVKLTKKPNKK